MLGHSARSTDTWRMSPANMFSLCFTEKNYANIGEVAQKVKGLLHGVAWMRSVFHRLGDVNTLLTWLPVAGTVWGSRGKVQLCWRKCITMGGLWEFIKSIHSSSLFLLSMFGVGTWPVSCSYCHAPHPPWWYIPHTPKETLSSQVYWVMVFVSAAKSN